MEWSKPKVFLNTKKTCANYSSQSTRHLKIIIMKKQNLWLLTKFWVRKSILALCVILLFLGGIFRFPTSIVKQCSWFLKGYCNLACTLETIIIISEVKNFLQIKMFYMPHVLMCMWLLFTSHIFSSKHMSQEKLHCPQLFRYVKIIVDQNNRFLPM